MRSAHLINTVGRIVARSLVAMILSAFCGFAQQQSPSLRFAWLSDTHVGSPTGDEDLRHSIHDINRVQGLAFTLLTGDITEMGSDEELRLARTDLDSLWTPLLVIPGNHDTKWSGSGFTSFTRLLGSERFVAMFDSIVLIGMHEGPIMRMGDGHFAPEDLRWLDSVAVSPAVQGKSVVFCTHYPVDSSIDNWYEVTDRLRRLHTIAVLCGHGHRNGVFAFEGIPGIMDRSNLRGTETVGGYSIVELSPEQLVVREKRPDAPAGQPWVVIPIASVARPSKGPACPRPSFAINDRYPLVHDRWTINRGWTITGGACIADSIVVVGDRSGVVTGCSLADGSVRWTVHMDGPVCSTPAARGGKIVVAAADGSVACLDCTDGSLVWKVQTGGPIVAAPCIAGDVVLIGSSDGHFFAISFGNGSPLWERTGIAGFVETRPLVYHDKVMFGAWDSYFYSLNGADGSLAWKWSNGNPARLLSPAACWAVASKGRVFIVAPDRYMTALDGETGKAVWRSNNHMVRESMGISEDGSRIYARSMRDTLFAFSAQASTQQTLWQTICGYGYDIDPSMCVEKDGTVYFGTKNGLVFAVNAADGTIRWVRKIGETIVNTPAPVDGRRVVVTDFDGRVALLEGTE